MSLLLPLSATLLASESPVSHPHNSIIRYNPPPPSWLSPIPGAHLFQSTDLDLHPGLSKCTSTAGNPWISSFTSSHLGRITFAAKQGSLVQTVGQTELQVSGMGHRCLLSLNWLGYQASKTADTVPLFPGIVPVDLPPQSIRHYKSPGVFLESSPSNHAVCCFPPQDQHS